MDERKDILFGIEPGGDGVDLLIRSGDFVTGPSDLQHVLHILEASAGQYRQWPVLGAAVRRMLNGAVTGTEKRDVSVHLRLDGYKAKGIRFDGSRMRVSL